MLTMTVHVYYKRFPCCSTCFLSSISTCVIVAEQTFNFLSPYSCVFSIIYLAKVPNDLIELHSYRKGSSRRPQPGCSTLAHTHMQSRLLLHSNLYLLYRVTLNTLCAGENKRWGEWNNKRNRTHCREQFPIENKNSTQKSACCSYMAVEVVLYHYGAGYQWGVYRRVRIRHREKGKAHTGMNQVSTGDREKERRGQRGQEEVTTTGKERQTA